MIRNAKWPLLAVMAVSCADVEHPDAEQMDDEQQFAELATLAPGAPGICKDEFVPANGVTQPANTLTDAQFYAWSSADNGSLSNYVNGNLVRCQKLKKGANDPYQKYRVLYRTSTKVTTAGATTELPLIASGQVWVPPVAASTFPNGAQPVLSNTHGAIGVQAQCAPSRGRYTDSQAAMRDLSTGTWANSVVTVPDYVGLGVDHGYRTPDSSARDPFGHTYLDRTTHPFVSIESEGRASIDLVRSAKEIPGAYVTDNSKWLVAGVSQGGHAALATAEVWSRDDYNKAGPKLKGAIAGAPASELQNPSWWPAEAKDSVFAMLAAGITLENRDIRASTLFNDLAKVAYGATTNVSCFNNAQALLTWWTAYRFSGTSIFNQSIDSIFNNPTYKALLTKNSPGNLAVPLKVPVFIGTLRGDPMVREERVRAAVALYQSKPANNVTFCYYSPVVNGSGNVANAANHDAFRRMFPQKNPDGSWVDQPQTPACVGTNSGSKVITPVQWASAL